MLFYTLQIFKRYAVHTLVNNRISWGLSHEALKIIYNGAILPQLLYAAPVWIDSMENEYN